MLKFVLRTVPGALPSILPKTNNASHQFGKSYFTSKLSSALPSKLLPFDGISPSSRVHSSAIQFFVGKNDELMQSLSTEIAITSREIEHVESSLERAKDPAEVQYLREKEKQLREEERHMGSLFSQAHQAHQAPLLAALLRLESRLNDMDKVLSKVNDMDKVLRKIELRQNFENLNPWMNMTETDRSRQVHLRGDFFQRVGVTDATVTCTLV
jgi:hypothetical protein